MKFETDKFIIAWIAGTLLAMFIAPIGIWGYPIIGMLIGLTYEEMCRYNKILEALEK